MKRIKLLVSSFTIYVLYIMVIPAISMACGEEGPERDKQCFKEVAEAANKMGVEMVITILGAVTILIVAVIVIPRAVRLIKRFI